MAQPAVAPPAAKGLVPAVLRAARLLEALRDASHPLGLATLAEQLELPKSSVLGLCATLVETHLVERLSDGRYQLGIRVVDLGRAYIARTDLAASFARASEQVPELAAETLVLSMLDGTDAVFIANRSGAHPVGVTWYQVGRRIPAHCTATGKAMLSTKADTAIRSMFSDPLVQLTPRSIGTVDGLLRDLRAIRKRGFAIDHEESSFGAVCLGAPVFDATGTAVAGIAVCFVNSRSLQIDQPGMAELVRDLASRMSRVMGSAPAARAAR
jgi:DNA-binding IclR family transcriptional regulator